MSKFKKKEVDALSSAFSAGGADVVPEASPAAPPAKVHVDVTAHALVRVPGEGWTFVEYKIRGKEVVSVTASKPDLKAVAMGQYRQAVAVRMAQSGDD